MLIVQVSEEVQQKKMNVVFAVVMVLQMVHVTVMAMLLTVQVNAAVLQQKTVQVNAAVQQSWMSVRCVMEITVV